MDTIDIAAVCRSVTPTGYDEHDIHTAIQTALTDAGCVTVREHVLGDAGRVDLWLPRQRTVVEIKARRGDPRKIRAQLIRYRTHRGVDRVILVSTVARHRPTTNGIDDCDFVWINLFGGM